MPRPVISSKAGGVGTSDHVVKMVVKCKYSTVALFRL
jgi:hypothetical protein